MYLWKCGYLYLCECGSVYLRKWYSVVCGNVVVCICGNVVICIYVNVVLCVCGNVVICICVNVVLWICGNVVLCEFYSKPKTRRTRILSSCSSCHSLTFYYNQIVMSVVSLFHSSLTVMIMRCWWVYSEPVMVVILLRSKGTSWTVMVA